MNSFILNELEAIKWMLLGILICLIVFVIWVMFSMAYTIRLRKAEFEAAACARSAGWALLARVST